MDDGDARALIRYIFGEKLSPRVFIRLFMFASEPKTNIFVKRQMVWVHSYTCGSRRILFYSLSTLINVLHCIGTKMCGGTFREIHFGP